MYAHALKGARYLKIEFGNTLIHEMFRDIYMKGLNLAIIRSDPQQGNAPHLPGAVLCNKAELTFNKMVKVVPHDLAVPRTRIFTMV